ncbi:MAG: hypothetical protein NUV59_03205 [Patescibacteria group bacterium]|nr:hypothetical protein [Patescibacteria group bacterium]
MRTKKLWAFIIGVALGDGNLSNPNGRAIRLRITCDARYPVLAEGIVTSLRILLPRNSVSIVRVPNKRSYFNISVYSNELRTWMPWSVGKGSKVDQKVRVPEWIRNSKTYSKECLRGLIQTDGSIYRDRGYLMVNFTNASKPLAQDVRYMLTQIGYMPTMSASEREGAGGHKMKHTVRVARNSQQLIEDIGLFKA